jgi:hypothetical protein
LGFISFFVAIAYNVLLIDWEVNYRQHNLVAIATEVGPEIPNADMSANAVNVRSIS